MSNPYPVALDWTDVVTGGDLTDAFPVAYIWDDSLNAGSGAYRINYGYPLPPGLPQDLVFDGPIPAMQSFWIKATASGASVNFNPTQQAESLKLFKQAPVTTAEESGWLALTVSTGEVSDQLIVFEAENYDVPKLPTLAFRNVQLSAMDSAGSWASRSLSAEDVEELRISLSLSSTETGTFTMSWQGMDTFDPDWQFVLADNATGEQFNLSEKKELSIELQSEADLYAEGFDSRFELIIGVGTTVATETETELPQELTLAQNYPNPFNPSTNIGFALPQTGNVELHVYDILGRRVATLIDQRMEAGRHEVTFNASRFASGMYLYQLRTSSGVITKKLTLIK